MRERYNHFWQLGEKRSPKAVTARVLSARVLPAKPRFILQGCPYPWPDPGSGPAPESSVETCCQWAFCLDTL